MIKWISKSGWFIKFLYKLLDDKKIYLINHNLIKKKNIKNVKEFITIFLIIICNKIHQII